MLERPTITSDVEISVAMSKAGGCAVAEFMSDPLRTSEEGWEVELAPLAYRTMLRIDLEELR